jgi:ABC-type antimicrobial peptide transport system permease subunit
VATGIAGALALHAILRALIVGADQFDLFAFALPAAILTLVAIAASLAPLIRAIRVDPITALRMD